MSVSVSARPEGTAAAAPARGPLAWRGVLGAATPGVAVDTLPGAQLAIDCEGRVVAATLGAARLLGREVHELRDRPLAQLLPALALAEPGAQSGETRAVHRGGEVLHLRWQFGPFDRTLGLQVLMLHDLGDTHALERELTRARLRIARLQKEFERFAYVASNDLQEPLRMVASFTELLTRRYRDRLDEQGQEFLYFAHDGARRMRALLNALFEYSRLGVEALPLQPVDLARVHHEVLRSLSLALHDAGGTIVAGALPVINGQRAQLRTLFYHLLSNAIRFRAPERTLRVEISATRSEAAWQLCFADNGSGIPAEHRARVLAMFQRLPRDRRLPGTGMGLALCRKICELQGGSIAVEANTPAGTRIVVTWPDAPR
ncbi:MAG TPA: ATP-binding protein [Gammaproteobacteria bacterium]|nr:ATP-binding protein [Gammaproteobacteria bacterium]